MKRFSTGIFGVLCLASLACGGGGGGGSKDCGDLASSINTCMTSEGGEANPNIQAMCEAATCTSKQNVIDTIAGLKCDETMREQSIAAWSAGGCKFPATCQGVAYTLNLCGDQDVTQIETYCNGLDCGTEANKTAAIECIVALDCATGSDSEFLACLSDNDCPVPS